jgi:peptide-methionine (S)-S-oxide reductase
MATSNLSRRIAFLGLVACIGALAVSAVHAQPADKPSKPASAQPVKAQAVKSSSDKEKKLEVATFGNGCFWCTEAVFEELKGVESAVSGYSGGRVPNPTYEQVCTGATGHAEVIQVTYDPEVISFPELLEVFWQTHDPTTLNQQGPDHGTQYRSAVFYHNDEQRKEAEHYKQRLDEAGAFDAPIVTEITEFKKFYPAEDYHQQYFEANPRQPYCRAVVKPKVVKFRKAFKDKLKVNDKSHDEEE